MVTKLHFVQKIVKLTLTWLHKEGCILYNTYMNGMAFPYTTRDLFDGFINTKAVTVEQYIYIMQHYSIEKCNARRLIFRQRMRQMHIMRFMCET